MNPWAALTAAPMPRLDPVPVRRAYIAQRLLEHGALDFPQFREITGWPTMTAAQVLWRLAHRGAVKKKRVKGTRRFIYELAK